MNERGPLIYQVYPRSFYDSDGDGVGDLEGVRRKLGYIASLGVDMIWLSPFFRSPMKDFGYDVSDYVTVDPVFGSNAVFEALLRGADELGMRVMIDLVCAHTSNEHPWFQQSRLNRTNTKSDWYVWADPQPDGGPPTNWRALFGGPAFVYDNRRRQYYLRHFLTEQPALNLHSEQVRRAMIDVLRFWLDLGVGGVRLDAVPFFFHDRKLRPNPPSEQPMVAGGVTAGNPFSLQEHRYDMIQPETVDFLGSLRKVADEYDAFLLGEVACQNQVEVAASYVGPELLHSAYTMELLDIKEPISADRLKGAIVSHLELLGAERATWTFGNHDSARMTSRLQPRLVGKDAHLGDGLAKMILALELTLPGGACVYQGDELGLRQPLLSIDEMRDPYDRMFYPDHLGRDGARAPIAWSHDAISGGFSSSESTWLPVPDSHRSLAVDVQEKNPDSVLSVYRRLASMRNNEPSLQGFEIRMLETPDPIVAYERTSQRASLTAFFNVSHRPTCIDIAESVHPPIKVSHRATLEAKSLELGPYGFIVV